MGLGDWKSRCDKSRCGGVPWRLRTELSVRHGDGRRRCRGTAVPLRLLAADRRGLAERRSPRPAASSAIPAIPSALPCWRTPTTALSTWTTQTLCVGSFSQGLCFRALGGRPAEWLDYDGQVPAGQRGPTGREERDLPSARTCPTTNDCPRGGCFLWPFRTARSLPRSAAFRGRVRSWCRCGSTTTRCGSSLQPRRQAADPAGRPGRASLGLLADGEGPRSGIASCSSSATRSRTAVCGHSTRGRKTIRRLTAYEHYIQWISGNRGGRVVLALANADCSQWHAVEYDLARDRQELSTPARPRLPSMD